MISHEAVTALLWLGAAGLLGYFLVLVGVVVYVCRAHRGAPLADDEP